MAIAKTGVLLILGILFSCSSSSKQEYTLQKDSVQESVSTIKSVLPPSMPDTAPLKKESVGISDAIEADYSCKHYNWYSAKQRRQLYPFNKARRIEVISFIGSEEHEVVQDEPAIVDYIPATTDMESDSMKMIVIRPEKKAEPLSFQSPMMDSLVLTQPQIDQLTNLLYNYDFANAPEERSVSLCYDPHHKIVFYNAASKPFAFIEICFECHQFATSEKVQLKTFCQDKWTLLEGFFHTIGITYGLPSYEIK